MDLQRLKYYFTSSSQGRVKRALLIINKSTEVLFLLIKLILLAPPIPRLQTSNEIEKYKRLMKWNLYFPMNYYCDPSPILPTPEASDLKTITDDVFEILSPSKGTGG
eukprot:NODE_173_length_14219_cov_0.603824.p13 type:complete len:107 gc:universal NODE_173_length_14219_cov_0.603824:11728-12048(+)